MGEFLSSIAALLLFILLGSAIILVSSGVIIFVIVVAIFTLIVWAWERAGDLCKNFCKVVTEHLEKDQCTTTTTDDELKAAHADLTTDEAYVAPIWCNWCGQPWEKCKCEEIEKSDERKN